MEMAMIERVQLRCSPELRQKVEEEARKEGKSISDFVRETVMSRVSAVKKAA